ncbi:MAG: PxKF domain-containing protein, partial [Mycobacteriaceae bacterium]
LQPINDTAHFIGSTTSIFKAGSTVPVKFQLTDALGQVVQEAAPGPVWLAPVKGGALPSTATVDESSYTTTATASGFYKWDPTSSQYIYNWNTTKSAAGSYWRIGVQLDDGTTHYVSIGLR